MGPGYFRGDGREVTGGSGVGRLLDTIVRGSYGTGIMQQGRPLTGKALHGPSGTPLHGFLRAERLAAHEPAVDCMGPHSRPALQTCAAGLHLRLEANIDPRRR
jgi:hypothetical protein